METTQRTEKETTGAAPDGVLTSPLIPDLVIRPISEEARRQALEGIAELRALREEILAHRGGRPISLDEVVGALDESGTTAVPEVEGRPISIEELVGALHEARAAHERGE
jgi:hypothetical protein